MKNAKTELIKLAAVAAITLGWKAYSDLKARVRKLEEIDKAFGITYHNTMEAIDFQGQLIVELDKRVSELEAERAAE